MPTATVAIHVRTHRQSEETLKALVEKALDLGFPAVTFDETTTVDAHMTITTTLTYKQNRHDDDTAVRTAVENVLSNTPVHVMATEMEYASPRHAPQQSSPRVSSTHR